MTKVTKKKRKEVEAALRAACLLRDGYKCLMCGKTTYLQMSHIYPKGKYPWMRFELDNVLCQCRFCHLYIWHRSPIDAYEWLHKTIPMKRLNKLRMLAQSPPNRKK